MLFDIFKKANSEKGKPLKYYIPNCKKYRGADIFVKIYNDLDSDTFKNDVFAFMTYAYARRTVASFLFFQGHFNQEEMNYQQKVFQSIQHQTNASYDFQEDTAAASLEFLQEYSSWFTKQNCGIATGLAVSGTIVDCKAAGVLQSANEVQRRVTEACNRHNESD